MSEKQDALTYGVPGHASGDDANSDNPRDGPKAIVKNVDMAEEMQQEAVDIAAVALEKYNIEKDIAAHIKREFDKKFGPTWHVVVGKNFGSYVTHGMPVDSTSRLPFSDARLIIETKHFIYFYVGSLAILIWKS
jgi:dynein light chain LC8-type